jgi:hypothetical protein
VKEIEREREKIGKKAQDFVTQSYALHEAFALSVRSLKLLPRSKMKPMPMLRESGNS